MRVRRAPSRNMSTGIISHWMVEMLPTVRRCGAKIDWAMGGMDDKITKVEYFREHAQFLSAVAHCLKRGDKNRNKLLSVSYHLENLAEAAEREAHHSATSDNRKKKSELARGRAMTTTPEAPAE